MYTKKMILTLLCITGVSFCYAQRGCDYPCSLKYADGREVKELSEWERSRKPELLRIFAEEVYGVLPDTKVKTSYKVLGTDARALGGKATRKEVRATYSANGLSRSVDILLYYPNRQGRRAPVFVGLNFSGNHTVTTDPVTMPSGWVSARGADSKGKATEEKRGFLAGRWPVEELIDRGYAVATAYCGHFYPDREDGFEESVCKMLYKKSDVPDSMQCKAIGAWAWGLSRIFDYLETEKAVDTKRAAVLGHSRLGKAAIWAGVQDPRFALVISNESGCGGAALFRCKIGEQLERIDRVFPHWFAGTFHKYGNRESALPVDQNNLLSLVAPRGLYVASAVEDEWSDPWGEFYAAYLAGEVYNFYGKTGLTCDRQPPLNTPVGKGFVGYHVREGAHDINLYDWTQFMNFADGLFR